MGSARIGDREIITIEQTNRLVLRWTTLTDDGMSLKDWLEVDVGEPPYAGIRNLVELKLARLSSEDALSHPIRRGIVLRDGEVEQPFLEPISYQETVDIIVGQARVRAEVAAFAVLARERAIPGWTSQNGTWVELTPEELSFVASLTGLPELHICEGDRVMVLLNRPVDGVIAIVLRGEVSFDDKEGWTGIEWLVSSNFGAPFEAEDEIRSLVARLLPADNVSLRIEPHRVRGELIDQLRILQKAPAAGRVP